MRLESLLALIEGELLTTPSITSFHEIVINPKRVLRGDLFIAVDASIEDIHLALENGAYGIVTDMAIEPLDSEVAWVHVPYAKEAELHLLRFHLLPKKLDVYSACSTTISYLQMLTTNSSDLIFIQEDVSTVSAKLWGAKPSTKLIVKDQENLLTIFPTAVGIEETKEQIEVNALFAFESDLSINGQHYKRQRLPYFLSIPFKKALGFLIEHGISWSLDALTFPKEFKILFYDRFLQVKEFGKGVKTIIYLEDDHYLNSCKEAIEVSMPWSHLELFLNQSSSNLSYNNATIYQDKETLLGQLESRVFDCAIVVGSDPIIESFSKKPEQMSLF